MSGIGLEAGDVLLGEIVKPRDVLPFGSRNFEYLLEGAHLIMRDDAVGLGHLGRQRDHRDGKSNAAA